MAEVMTEYDKKWHLQYQKLRDFKRMNGHCIVKSNNEQDKAFRRWVANQRQFHNNNQMRLDRKELLDELGFIWRVDRALWQADMIAARVSGDDKKWHQHYERLVEFKEKNGHCLVPFNYEQDNSLGNWVFTQRMNHTKNKMRQDRKELLDEVEFVWKVDIAVWKAGRIAGRISKKWRQQYKDLVDFKEMNGPYIVPRGYNEDKSLGQWAGKQWTCYISNKMLQDREDVLNEMGFVRRVVVTLAARSSTTDVRGLVIWIISRFWVRSFICLTLALFVLDLCVGIRFRVGIVDQQCEPLKRTAGGNETTSNSRPGPKPIGTSISQQ